MVKPIKTFRHRRLLNTLSLLLASMVAVILYALDSVSLERENFFSGWVLFTAIAILTAFNLRKKISVIPLLHASTWMQFHIYLGIFTILLFILHIRFLYPTGLLETGLATIYILVTFSGMVGIWLSRSLPSRLTRRGENILFERISAIRRKLKDEVEDLALQPVQQNNSTTIADFYTNKLAAYFSAPRNFWFHLFESNRPYFNLRNEMAVFKRYLNTEEKEIFGEIAYRVRLKDDLDYQYAGQAILKRWLFFHIPLTYCLLVFSVLHVLVNYAFIGG